VKTRYRIEDAIVDTTKATYTHKLESVKKGYGHDRRSLHRSRKGRWYLVHDHDWCEDGRDLDFAEWVSPAEAVRLILADGGDLPDYPEIAAATDDVVE
jgi:hypothetical protein